MMDPVMIDRFGELDRRVREFAPIAKEHEILKLAIRNSDDVARVAADQPAILEGKLYTIQVGAREFERRFKSLDKVRKACGSMTKFFRVVSVAIGKLEDEIGKDVVAQLVTKDRTGARPIAVVAKASPSLPQQKAA